MKNTIESESNIEKSTYKEFNILNERLTADEELWREIKDFLYDHIDLVNDAEYHILTAKIFESYVQFKFDFLGYTFFLGPPKSGKTRALETLQLLVWNPQMAPYMTHSVLFRLIEKEYFPTLLLDEIQHYLSGDFKEKFFALMNAGQRKGQCAVINTRGAEDDWEPTKFETYCSKFMASTKDTANALGTRSIYITMTKNARRMPLRIDKERAEELHERLVTWMNDNMAKRVRNVDELFENLGFGDNRLVEIFWNLVSIAPPVYMNIILDYAKDLDDAKADGPRTYGDGAEEKMPP